MIAAPTTPQDILTENAVRQTSFQNGTNLGREAKEKNASWSEERLAKIVGSFKIGSGDGEKDSELLKTTGGVYLRAEALSELETRVTCSTGYLGTSISETFTNVESVPIVLYRCRLLLLYKLWEKLWHWEF